MNHGTITIIKASGEREVFSADKLRHSLTRAHATPEVASEIVADIEHELHDSMTTNEIYRKAFSYLRKKHRPIASRYALKEAIRQLGPSGHPFETLIGALMVADGYESVEVSKVVQGVCVRHEIDVVAQKGDKHIMVECKFHNQPGIKSDVKISLYVEARFRDLEKAWHKSKTGATLFHEMWLVTNTKLTSDAIMFAECVGMKAIGWSYPENAGLEQRIERAGLHPITCMTTLTRSQKNQLREANVVLCKDLSHHTALLSSIGLSPSAITRTLDEATQLCNLT